MEQILRKHRCCFSGHRPGKLRQSKREVCLALEAEICRAIDDGYVTFITGMAQGVDLWAAEIVLQYRAQNPKIHLACACPFPWFDANWSAEWKTCYQNVLKQSDKVRYISDAYHPECFSRRNRWMVDRSSRLIAVWNGLPGGTKQTIRYAKKKGIDVYLTK